MKILSIGLYGIPGSKDADLISANVLQDYEAIVVNPDNLRTLYGEYSGSIFAGKTSNILSTEFADFAENINPDRRQQVKGLIQKNGVVICFLRPFMGWQSLGGKLVTNYDWLFDTGEISAQFGNIIYGTGTTISYINPHHYFTEYLLTKPNWNSYIPHDSCDQTKWKIIASAFGTHILSLASTTKTGHIILLPSGYQSKNGKLLEQCITKLLGDKEITPTPEWAKPIIVPGQDKMRQELDKVNTEIKAVAEKQGTLISNIEELDSWKWLLYETGKHRLEPIVHKALSSLGCKVEDQPDSDSDGKVETEFGIALLEIEGVKGTIKIDKISQLLKNIANFLTQEGFHPKGILIGNPFRLEEPINRPPKNSQKKFFSDEVISTAETHNISVLLSTDLYEIVCLILDNKLTTTQIESIRKDIFQGKGLVRLSIC